MLLLSSCSIIDLISFDKLVYAVARYIPSPRLHLILALIKIVLHLTDIQAFIINIKNIAKKNNIVIL